LTDFLALAPFRLFQFGAEHPDPSVPDRFHIAAEVFVETALV
jgi:hypothetical protein